MACALRAQTGPKRIRFSLGKVRFDRQSTKCKSSGLWLEQMKDDLDPSFS